MREQTPRKPRLRECTSCGEVKMHKARDMCVGCYGRWRWQNRKAAEFAQRTHGLGTGG